VLNLTAGMAATQLGDQQPLPLDPEGTDMAGADERLAHGGAVARDLHLDCGSMNRHAATT
jgi:uncharacterized protein (DUF849 family)